MELDSILPYPATIISPDVIYYNPDSYKFSNKEAECLQTLLNNAFDSSTHKANFVDPNYDEIYLKLLRTKVKISTNNPFKKFLFSKSSLDIANQLIWLAIFDNLPSSYCSTELTNLKHMVFDSLALQFYDFRTKTMSSIHETTSISAKIDQEYSIDDWCIIICSSLFIYFYVSLNDILFLNCDFVLRVESLIRHLLLGISYHSLKSSIPLFHSSVHHFIVKEQTIYKIHPKYVPKTLEVFQFIPKENDMHDSVNDKITKKSVQTVVSMSIERKRVLDHYHYKKTPSINEITSELMERALEIHGIKNVPAKKGSSYAPKIPKTLNTSLRLKVSIEDQMKNLNHFEEEQRSIIREITQKEAHCGADLVSHEIQSKKIKKSLHNSKTLYDFLENNQGQTTDIFSLSSIQYD